MNGKSHVWFQTRLNINTNITFISNYLIRKVSLSEHLRLLSRILRNMANPGPLFHVSSTRLT